jgi:DDE superfamily endonuclease
MDTTAALDSLHAFRADVYASFRYRADALFELMDALLSAGTGPSPVHLSLAPIHRRGWGSLYAALTHGRMARQALRDLVARPPLAEGHPLYAVDVSVWPRCDAETSPERGYYYHASRHSAGPPIVAGGADQWINHLNLTPASWTAPLDVQRVPPREDANTVAAAQIKALVGRLQRPASSLPAVFRFAAGYDPIPLALDLGETPVAVLVRLRKNRCFDADPDPTTTATTGRPRRQGRKFSCADPSTWWSPTAEYTTDDPGDGRVRVRVWANVQAIPQNHATKGTGGPKPLIRGTLILGEVSHLPRPTRLPRPLWLWWHGPEGSVPDLALLWRAYVRRFDQEPTFRFLKRTLSWTTPRLRTPEQAARWTWLVLRAYTQLRLARPLVADQRLPWERPLRPQTLTPDRVYRAFSTLLPLIGTPANPPQTLWPLPRAA